MLSGSISPHGAPGLALLQANRIPAFATCLHPASTEAGGNQPRERKSPQGTVAPGDGETRTRTGDTTIFRQMSRTLERTRKDVQIARFERVR